MSDRMVWVPGGKFAMGSDKHYPEEGPVRHIEVPGFWIDPRPVTNAEFVAFVDETDHTTEAEIAPVADQYPGAREDDLVPGSLVFTMTQGPADLGDYRSWWRWVPGVDWKCPTGPKSSIEGLDDHPVVHVAYADAVAYAEWAGKQLATESEWEYAARGGLEGAEFVWGDEDSQETDPRANTWQGRFPYENSELDGWVRTSPVGSYEPNGYGLFDMAGNVWEWTDDWYVDRHAEPAEHSCCAPAGMRGGTSDASMDPSQPEIRIPRKVVKGGSHLCTIQYCFRYRPAARQPEMIDTSTSHLGFRCIRRE